MEPVRVKVVVVGDGMCGKTALLSRFKSGEFIINHPVTVIENFTHKMTVDGQDVLLDGYDTAGQEDYDRLRPLAYPDTSVFIVCFSVECDTSFQDVRNRWYPELRHYCPGAALILVGCKSDLRTDEEMKEKIKNKFILADEAHELANSIGAYSFHECSAKTGEGVVPIFHDVVRAAQAKTEPPKRSFCELL